MSARSDVGVVSTILLFGRLAAGQPDSSACDQLPRDTFRNARHLRGGPHKPHRHHGHHRHQAPPPPPVNPGIPGIDSLANFDLAFTSPGFAADGSSIELDDEPGAFSYPDQTLLTATTPLLQPLCQPPAAPGE